MIEIIHVDEGEVLLRFFQTMPKFELIELLEQRLKISVSLIILYTTEGRVIDLDSIHTLQSDHELYLFRRDRVVDYCTISQNIWTEYKDFGEIDLYELGFNFDNYEKFPQGFEKVPRIEKGLYDLYCHSKLLYSKFMVKFEYIERCKSFIEVRVKASKVLLNNLKLYYKEIKLLWKHVYSSVSELHIQYMSTYKQFEKYFQSFIQNSAPDPITLYIKDTKLNLFISRLMKKLNKCLSGIHEVKNAILSKIKQQLVNSFRETDRVWAFYRYSSEMYSEFNLQKKAEGFTSLLKVCDLYSICRDNINYIVNKNWKDKKTALNEILELEKSMNKYKELSLQQTRVLEDIDPIENAIKECVIRVEEVYKDKVVVLTSIAAQKLKYKVKSKLDRFEKKLRTLRGFQEFLKIPMNVAEAQKCYKDIKAKHKKNKLNLKKTYEKIAFNLISDNIAKQEFLEGSGKLLPSQFYERLKSPLMEKTLIKKILALEDEPQDQEVEKIFCEKQEIIEFYEAEIESFEGFIEKAFEEYRSKEVKIEEDISKTVLSIKEIEEDFSYNEVILKNVRQELEIVKAIGQENLKHKLMEEVQKLKEKEEAFKMIFMEKLKELINLNEKLRFSG